MTKIEVLICAKQQLKMIFKNVIITVTLTKGELFMIKKVLAALMAAVAVRMFVACDKEEKKPVAGNNGGTSYEQVVVGEGEIDYESGLSTERYDGYNFRMFIPKGFAIILSTHS